MEREKRPKKSVNYFPPAYENELKSLQTRLKNVPLVNLKTNPEICAEVFASAAKRERIDGMINKVTRKDYEMELKRRIEEYNKSANIAAEYKGRCNNSACDPSNNEHAGYVEKNEVADKSCSICNVL
eukprot:TRINITY_DN4908_c0_g1_i10.p1 TRINITY_DN4908_c0_g1~~TRINITY_DN4908_c0_g1_i10.p1  ORF type:complete len:127 (+),score=30.29 TRINITY_DN4908_c0_g1_i10:43-423(+)